MLTTFLDNFVYRFLPFLAVDIGIYFLLLRPSLRKGYVQVPDTRLLVLSTLMLIVTVFVNNLARGEDTFLIV